MKKEDVTKEMLPSCIARRPFVGDKTCNTCFGHEPYSCERMFADFGCPRGKELILERA